jgi:RNA polymerase sigma factor (sigma-70 family)
MKANPAEDRTARPDFDTEAVRRRLSAAIAQACPNWLRHEREDLLQTTLLRVWEVVSRAEVRPEMKATYLYRAAYSVTIDEIRKARWRYERALSEDPMEEKPATAERGPEESALAAEIATSVRSCLQGLDPGRRRAVQLRLAGSGHAAAAEMLGLTVKQFSNLVFRGMEDLRSCLRSKGVSA